MTDLPTLENWLETRRGLHQAAQVIGGVRKVDAEPEPNWAHLGLRAVPEGVTTGALPRVGTLTLNFVDRAIIHAPVHGSPRTMPLGGHTQRSLADFIDEALAQTGVSLRLDRAKITSNEPISIDSALAGQYAQVLNWAADILTTYRDSLPSEKSKLVIWPHGFDTSFLWFATPDASENSPHMAFGFSPRSEGLDRPYFYAYAHPNPDGLLKTSLPASARWHTSGWTGMVLDYDTLRATDHPDQSVLSAFRVVFDAAASHLENSR